jgi:cytochrome c oxidase cbb3-type subunit III
MVGKAYRINPGPRALIMSLLLFLPLFLQVQVLDLPTVEKNPYTSEADVAFGKRLYAGRCAGCHGPTGDGGKGANLAVPKLPRGSTDLALYRTIRYGIPETEMPSANLTEKEVWQIAAFVRTLGRIDRSNLPGDPARGKQLVHNKAGCLQCHPLGMEGGGYGPSLTDVGARRSPGYLKEKLLNPGVDSESEFRLVQLSLSDGRTISGIRLNEDTYSVQLRDLQNRLFSFRKEQLRDYKVERKTLMPSYSGKLTAAEIDDVVAYLAGLRGEE